MSAQSSEPADDGRPAESTRSFTTGIGSMVGPAAEDETAVPARPTFTARPPQPAADTMSSAVPGQALAPDDTTVDDTTVDDMTVDDTTVDDTPVHDTPVHDTPVDDTTVDDVPADGTMVDDTMPDAPAAEAGLSPGADLASVDGTGMRPGSQPAMADLDEPLLADVAGLRARWQRVQAGFVDDPKEAVGDAADLIEQTAQAMVGALRQRQRQLRVLWEHGPVDDTAAADGQSAARSADTEHLRQMMQHYRALFNQLCRP